MSTDTQSIEDELRGSPYVWIRNLARGGMGEVHIVSHAELGSLSVLKVLRADLPDPSHAERLRAEARLLTLVRHPNLVRVLDFGWTRSRRPYVVTELLEGETLGERLRRDKRMSEGDAIPVARQTLRGLAAVHAKGIVHRDVKPDNLFLAGPRDAPEVRILDFGVAKILNSEVMAAAGRVDPTATGMIIGTPTYLAPEQVLAEDVDERSDIYAVGCLLYRMIVGVPPFMHDTQSEVLQAHLFETPAFPLELSDAMLRPSLRRVILRALEKKPADRFRSADEMIKAIDEALRDARPTPPGTVRIDVAEAPVARPRVPVAGGTQRIALPVPERSAPPVAERTPTPRRDALPTPPAETISRRRTRKLEDDGVVLHIQPDDEATTRRVRIRSEPVPASPLATTLPAKRRDWVVLASVVGIGLGLMLIGLTIWLLVTRP